MPSTSLTLPLSKLRAVKAERLLVLTPDGHYAYRQALQVEEQAVKLYLSALQEFKAGLARDDVDGTPHDISPRERQVLALIADGKSSKLIAHELGISFRTAISHRYRTQTKLKAHKKTLPISRGQHCGGG